MQGSGRNATATSSTLSPSLNRFNLLVPALLAYFRESTMGKTEEEELADYFDGLSHPIRIRIVRLLLSQECHVLEMMGHIPHVHQSTISHHLRILRSNRLIDFRRGNVSGRHGRRDGNYHYYFLCEPERVRRTLTGSAPEDIHE